MVIDNNIVKMDNPAYFKEITIQSIYTQETFNAESGKDAIEEFYRRRR